MANTPIVDNETADSDVGVNNDGYVSPFTPPTAAWQPVGKPFAKSFSAKGRSNEGIAVPTSKQVMSGQLVLAPYVFLGTDSAQYSYYLFSAFLRHGVLGYGANAISVGYYATSMSLTVAYAGGDMPNGDAIYQYGPGSSTGINTTSFVVGAELTGNAAGSGGEISGAFEVSFSSPGVSFAASTPANNTVKWTCTLPGVGYIRPGDPIDPETPSSAGFTWFPAFIVKCPAGQTPKLNVSVDLEWQFDYMRGITNDRVRWTDQWQLETTT
jgi:hypothetical protein